MRIYKGRDSEVEFAMCPCTIYGEIETVKLYTDGDDYKVDFSDNYIVSGNIISVFLQREQSIQMQNGPIKYEVSFENGTSKVGDTTFILKDAPISEYKPFRLKLPQVASFFGCKKYGSSRTNFDCTLLDTSNVVTGELMFSECEFLVMDCSGFDTSKMTNMDTMFGNNTYFTKTIKVDNFDTRKVTKMRKMFCTNRDVIELDLRSFDLVSVTDMSLMFANCDVQKLYLSSGFFNSTALTTYHLDGLTKWTDAETIQMMIDALPTISTSKTLKLSTQTKNAMTDAQKSTITSKGWTIA